MLVFPELFVDQWHFIIEGVSESGKSDLCWGGFRSLFFVIPASVMFTDPMLTCLHRTSYTLYPCSPSRSLSLIAQNLVFQE